MTDDKATEREIAMDFYQWCQEHRLLGRGRLWGAFKAGWAYGHATGVDHALEHMPRDDDHAG